MRIWFDLSNSPHVNMFAAMIRDLAQEHEVIITCRQLANTCDLLDLHRFKYQIVGTHYGGKLTAKLAGFPVRVMQLRHYLSRKNINVAVSQSSFHSPVVARLLNVRSIYTNDNEHALGNVAAFVCADTILAPECLTIEKLRKQWASSKKVVHYPGVKEGIYLWELDERIRHAKSSKNRSSRQRSTVYIRPEPSTAQYYKGARNFLDDLLLGMREEVNVVLLPRGKDQAIHYQEARFYGIRVVTTVLDIADIVPDCDMFIGAGGTMTREMAVLGIPTISVYQDDLLDVDRYLLKLDALVHKPELTADEALQHLHCATKRPPNRELLLKGKMAYEMFKDRIVNG